MIDPCQGLLLTHYRNQDKQNSVLWVLDENAEYLASQLKHDACQFLTNRWDINTLLDNQFCRFSDFEFEGINNIDTVFFRIPKEKAVAHHVINQSFLALNPGGQLIISGEKNDGIKTYEKKAALLFGQSTIEKHKNTYLVVLTKTTQAQTDKLLDDQNYSDSREISGIDGIRCYSKPGIFGWGKIDQGSELLIREFIKHSDKINKESKILDLGCGWGYLALTLNTLGFNQIDASDNNAGAVTVLQKTIDENHLSMQVWADNCASKKSNCYNIVLCNPPFHKGFDHSYPLTDTFLSALKRLLKPSGCAFIVVNQFIPVEKFANQYFASIELLSNTNGFKVFRLSNNKSK